MENTTDLKVIRVNPRRFTWGRIGQIHDIGYAPPEGVSPYTIVEYLPWGRLEADGANFHVYVDGKDQSVGSRSLEGAILIAIARRNLEANKGRFMAQAAAVLLGVKED